MVECPLLERQQTRLRFLNDRNLDAVHQRDVSAAQPLDISCESRRIFRRSKVVDFFAVRWIAFEHDARRASPLRKPERAGADRMRHDLIAVCLDDLVRNGAKRIRQCEQVDESRIGPLQPNLERVAIEHLQSLDVASVVEWLFPFSARCLICSRPMIRAGSRTNNTWLFQRGSNTRFIE